MECDKYIEKIVQDFDVVIVIDKIPNVTKFTVSLIYPGKTFWTK